MAPDPGTIDRWRRADAALAKLFAIRARGVTESLYARDSDLRDIVERNFQVVIEAAIDLANELIADRRWRTPSTAREAFEVLAENGALDAGSVSSFGGWVGFRNVIVHSYTEIKANLVVGFLNTELDDLQARFLRLATACGFPPPSPSPPSSVP